MLTAFGSWFRRRSGRCSWWLALGWLNIGCSIGVGEGEVTSERLFVESCWDGPFDLRPDFFGANPFRNAMMIRIQSGEQLEDVSDGVALVINDVAQVRENQGQELRLGLPAGVSPPTIPDSAAFEPADVSLTLYLNDLCHLQNSSVHAIGGWIRFDSLFSGDLNENDSDQRLTEGEFEAIVTDPRSAQITSEPGEDLEFVSPPEQTSRVSGWFRFFFHRGAPAQPFP